MPLSTILSWRELGVSSQAVLAATFHRNGDGILAWPASVTNVVTRIALRSFHLSTRGPTAISPLLCMALSTFYRAVPGREPAFHTTHWSVVLAAGENDRERAREALGQLCAAYWYPLYVFARRQGYNPTHTEDLTQEFFARLLESNDLAAVRPERGRFRSFLLASFKHLLANEYHRQQTQKRGGGMVHLSLEHEDPETRYRLEPVDPVTPEILFERRWALTVLERAVERMREEYSACEKADLFEELKDFLSNQKASPHEAIAAKYGISIGAVGVTIHRLRKRYAEILREEVAHTVSTPDEISDEIRHLIASVGR